MVLIFWEIPSNQHSSLVKCDVKHVLRSEITLVRNPKCGNTRVANNSATPAAPIVCVQGKNRVALLTSWFMTIRMESYPFEGGRSTIRSNAMVKNGWDDLSVVMGKRGTFRLLVLGLVA